MGNLVSRRGRKQVAESTPRPPTLPQNGYTASPRNQEACLPNGTPQHLSKKALLIGVRYEKARWPAKCSKKSMDLGVVTHKEVQTWRNMLMQHYGYRADQITCMQDTDQCRRDLWPSKENILAQLEELVRDVRPGDRRFLFIAGHGAQLASTSDPTELDGQDEILYTLEKNKKTCKIIKDNDLRRILAEDLPAGANLTVVLELCSSGTMMDLPFRLSASQSGSPILDEARSPAHGLNGNILCLSACEDPQKAHHFKHSSHEQGILTAVIGSTLAAARSPAPRIRVLDLLDGLVATCNQLRGNLSQQTPMVTIGKRLSRSELESLIFLP